MDRERKGLPVSHFLWARFFRIAPAYIVLLLGYQIVGWYYSTRVQSNTIQELLSNKFPVWVYICFGQSWYLVFSHTILTNPFGNPFLSGTWSLAAEVEYYLGAVLVVLLVKKERRTLVLVAIALLAILTRVAMTVYMPNSLVAPYLLPPARMDAFALGALVATILRSPALRSQVEMATVPLLTVLSLGMMFLTLNNCNALGLLATYFSHAWAALFLAFCLVWVVLRADRRPVTALAKGPLAWLGAVSYSVFLFHLPLHALFTNILEIPMGGGLGPNTLILFLIEMATIITIGALGYFLVERPCIAWVRRWAKTESLPSQGFLVGDVRLQP
jgi:peptidoglycan/LPS O-acetylase OafA/YrhL